MNSNSVLINNRELTQQENENEITQGITVYITKVYFSQESNPFEYEFDDDLDEDILALEYSCNESESDGKK